MEKSRSTTPGSEKLTEILFMYVSGALKRFDLSDTAITDNAPGKLFAAKLVPSSGSTAISNSGPLCVPTLSPRPLCLVLPIVKVDSPFPKKI